MTNIFKTLVSCRYVTTYVAFLCFLCLYTLRFNMSVAIVCMVKAPNVTHTETEIDSSTQSPVPEDDPCGGDAGLHKNSTLEGEFDWSRETQSYVLASFFYGYIITQLPGGWLSDHYGPKRVILVGMTVTTIATFLVPILARVHVGLVIMLRVVMGLGMGVGFPSLHSLFSKWAPPMERTTLIASAQAGKVVGDIVAFFGSGLLCQYGFAGGWPSVFYASGIITTVWLFLWFFFVFDSPAKHPRISAEERDFIESNIGRHVGKVESIPWKSIFTSLPMLAIVIAHVCDNWGRYTMMTSLPMYMKDVLKFDIDQNGLYSALPYVGMFFVAIIGSQMADFTRRKGASTTYVRKAMQSLGFMLPAALLSGIGFVGCADRNMAVAIVILAITLNAFTESAYMVNHVDIAPKYAGVMFAISNFFATLPGILAPFAVGRIAENGTREEWRTVFFICVGFYIFGTLVYCAIGSGKEQEWAKDQPKEEPQGKTNLAMDELEDGSKLPVKAENNGTAVAVDEDQVVVDVPLGEKKNGTAVQEKKESIEEKKDSVDTKEGKQNGSSVQIEEQITDSVNDDPKA